MPEDFNSVLKEKRVFNPSKEFSKKAHIKSMQEYKKIYKESVENPEKFWSEKANSLHWFKKWDKVLSSKGNFFKWFENGKLNVCYNCLDKNISEGKQNKIALIWEAENGQTIKYTYSQLLKEVSRFSNVLKSHHLKKGDRVCIYLPMIPELAISMLACARTGLIHSIVFGGFSSGSLKDRILDCEAELVITSDGSFRNGKIIPLKQNSDNAIEDCPSIKKVIVVKRCKNKIAMKKGRDLWWHEEMSKTTKDECNAAEMDSEDPLFILYTSGTTGKPKGVLHTQAGYLLYVYQTFKWIFDIRDNDVYWCTADIGWITGHSYIIYGPLSNGATTLMYEGGPMYPEPDRFWRIVEKHKISIFYTAPTAIRALMKHGDKWPKSCKLESLRLLGTVGESINPEAWIWYYNIIGNKKCPIVDTWWQTETGGILITPLPGATPLKPGSATLAFPGIIPDVVREDGSKTNIDEGGYLVIRKPWPGMLRTVWRNPKRYEETYFNKFKNIYLAGDSARIDKDSYFWILGRLDDVIKVAGHRIGSAEVESHIVSYKPVAEAAVVPIPDKIKGQAIYAFVVLKKEVKITEDLKKDIISHVANNMGHIAKPEKLQFAEDLPKTRSGKIMRRILKAIAEGNKDIGSTTTLADPDVVKKLQQERIK
ncbi:MAG: acetate--CoA ligase [Candidatus Woesearchaeota archaeon]|nr:acetate--CoA ligase [Candidatus Woesearchaeota archaeon]